MTTMSHLLSDRRSRRPTHRAIGARLCQIHRGSQPLVGWSIHEAAHSSCETGRLVSEIPLWKQGVVDLTRFHGPVAVRF